MQTPSGEVMSMSTPQGLTVSGGNAGYHSNQQASTQPMVTGTTQIEEAHSTTNHVSVQLSDNNDDDKRAIYKHPLFPLMALLLEKCEQATQTPDCPSCDSFDSDIQAFVHRQEQDRRPFFSDDLELDGLMVKAIQVLRIHLLELEKVSELCKDFCNRYIACLKGKLQSENLLRLDMQGFDDGSVMDDCLSPGALISNNNNNNNNLQGMQDSNVNLVIQGNVAQPSNHMPVGSLGQGQGLGQGQVISGGTVYQMVQTPQGLVAQPIQIQSPSQLSNQGSSGPVIQGNTPLSQIGLPNTPDTPTQHSPTTPSLPKDFNFDDDDYNKRKNKRGVLPKQATQVMKSWLFQHIMHPYPTEDEKRQIASQTNLTMLQVNNWFINARRRILQPMLDASNPEGPKAKKSKPQQNRPVQRFWPENLANMTSNRLSGDAGSPSASESPTSTTSSNLKMEGSYVEEDGDDDEDDMSYSTSDMDQDLHQPLLSHPGVPGPGLAHTQYVQTTQDVSSTSSSAATLSLIADVAMGDMQITNFLPVAGSNQGMTNVMSSLSSTSVGSLGVMGQDTKRNVTGGDPPSLAE